MSRRLPQAHSIAAGCNLQPARHHRSHAEKTLAVLAFYMMLSFWKSRFSTAACRKVHRCQMQPAGTTTSMNEGAGQQERASPEVRAHLEANSMSTALACQF